jgi:hypothetical protein
MAKTASIEARTLPAEKIEGMLKAVRALTVKPQKGRRKDLSRIEYTVETLGRAPLPSIRIYRVACAAWASIS